MCACLRVFVCVPTCVCVCVSVCACMTSRNQSNEPDPADSSVSVNTNTVGPPIRPGLRSVRQSLSSPASLSLLSFPLPLPTPRVGGPESPPPGQSASRSLLRLHSLSFHFRSHTSCRGTSVPQPGKQHALDPEVKRSEGGSILCRHQTEGSSIGLLLAPPPPLPFGPYLRTRHPTPTPDSPLQNLRFMDTCLVPLPLHNERNIN